MVLVLRCLAVVTLTGCLVTDETVDAYLDRDGDGARTFLAGGPDCDDDDATIGPAQPERCGNGIDDDCNGRIDEGGVDAIVVYPDLDQDGWGDDDAGVTACEATEGFTRQRGDCDDRDKDIHPDATEDCSNDVDDDCDDQVNEADSVPLRFPDLDGDGFGNPDGLPVASCADRAGYAPNNTDCDDTSALAYPGGKETPYDGIDGDCAGQADEFDRDGDGWGVDPAFHTVTAADWPPPMSGQLDCDDAVPSTYPGAPDEPYDGVDADCAGNDDYDADGDGHRGDLGGGDDCDDTDPARYPSAREIPYNDIDEDCVPGNDSDVDGDGRDAQIVGVTDCDDEDPNNWSRCDTCFDRDDDGAHAGCDAYETLTPDCNDADPEVWASCFSCQDADGDGVRAGCDAYLVSLEDCDDDNPTVWVNCDACRDADGDGHWTGCNRYDETHPRDCDDELANAWVSCGTCEDGDRDAWGVGSCDDVVDCDDADADVSEACGLCVDEDQDGSRTGCDRYLQSPYDCDDGDPEVGGHLAEILDDALDQDCNGRDLTVSERDGVFVAPDGVDTAGCGSMDAPCATPGFAEGVAFGGGKVLFLAEGEYPGFETRVSVFGGFEAEGWERGGETVVAEDSGAAALVARGPTNQIHNITLRPRGLGKAYSGLVLSSKFSYVRDVVLIESGIAETCRLISSSSHQLEIRRSQVSGCAASREAVGIQSIWPSPGSEVEIDDVSVDVVGSLAATRTRGLEVDADTVTIRNSRIDALNGRLVEAARADAPSLIVGDTTFAAGIGGTAEDGYGLVATSGDFWMSNANLHVESDSKAAALSLPGSTGSDVAHLSGSLLTARSLNTASALDSSVDGEIVLANNTLVTAAAGNGVSVLAPPSSTITLVNNLLLADGTVLYAQGLLTTEHNAMDAPCIARSSGGPDCPIEDVSEWDACSYWTCSASAGNLAGPFSLDGTASRPYAPSPTSRLVDGGTNPNTYLPEAHWLRRDQGGVFVPSRLGYDIGAVELPD